MRDLLLKGAGLFEDLVYLFDLCGNIFTAAIDFTQQNGGRIYRLATVLEFFHGLDSRPVEQFESGWNDAAGDDGGHGGAGCVD